MQILIFHILRSIYNVKYKNLDKIRRINKEFNLIGKYNIFKNYLYIKNMCFQNNLPMI